MHAYMGELEVEGREFSLNADQLIVREKDRVIRFKLSGHDDDGYFSIEGAATIFSPGKYVASEIEYFYRNYGKKEKATIHFDLISQSKKKLRCKIEGKWIQGSTWKFSGNLRKLQV